MVMIPDNDQGVGSLHLPEHQQLPLETQWNLLALRFGHHYRLDIHPLSGCQHVEFVRTLREARFVGIPVRQAGGVVKFYKIGLDGLLKRHSW